MAGMGDLNKMFKRGQKLSKQVPIKANSWITNVAKSFGYAAQEVLSDIAPNSVDIAQNTAETANVIRENLMQAKSQEGKVSSALDISTYLKLGKEYGKNAIEDLMSGNFYAKEREQKLYDDEFGVDDFDDFDFGDDFDAGEDDGGFEIEADSSSGNASATMTRKSKGRNEVTQVNIYNGFDEDNPLVKSTEFQTKVQVEATGVLVDTQKASMNTLLMHTTKLQKQTTAGLLSINDKLGQIHTTIAENQTRLINVSETYYNDSMELFEQMLDRLDTIKEHTAVAAVASAAKEVDDYTDRLDMFHGGMVSIKDYKAYVKKNINNAIESNMFTSQIKSMVSDTDVLKQAVATPLRGTVKNMIGQLIPQVVETSIKELDQTLGEFVITGLTKIGSYKNRYDNPILRTLGEIFGITNRYETVADKSKYEKGAVAWDGISHRTLNDVIPNYLRQIAAAVTGTEEMAFDYDRGIYRRLSDVQKEHENNLRSKALSPFFEDTVQFSEYLDKNYTSGTRKQKKEIQEKFENALRAMVARGGIDTYRVTKNSDGLTVDEFADLFGDRTGSRAVELARSFFEGRYGANNGSANVRTFGRNIQEARASVSRYTREVEADPVRYNGQYINNGLTNVNKETGRTTIGFGGLGGKDKYDMSVLDYLRKTLLTLNTGIDVRITNWDRSFRGKNAGKSPIREASDKILKEFDTKKTTLKDSKSREDSNSIGSLSAEEYDRAIKEGKIDINDADLNAQSMQSIATAYHQNRISERNRSNRKPSIIEKLAGRGGTTGKWFGKINDVINNLAQKTQSLFQSTNNFLYSLLFGSPDGRSRKDALLTSLITSMKISFHKFGDFLDKKVLTPLDEKLFGDDGLFAKLKETQFGQDMKKGFSRAKESVFGKKVTNPDGTTSYRGGILSNTANELSNVGKEAKAFLLGGKDAQGNKIDPEMDHSVLGEAKRMFRNMSSSITNAMGIGKDTSGKQMTFRDIISKGIDDVWKTTKERSSEWVDLIFGKRSDSDIVQTGRDVLDSFSKEMRGKSGKIGAGAVLGAGSIALFGSHLGIMGSLFLPGGPVGGALLGAGISIVNNSDTLKRLLFGDVDENGERLGGVISKQTQDFFNNNKTGVKVGAFAGLAASMGFLPAMMVPGGPIGGALIGGAVSLAAKSGAFNEFLYGPGGDKDDPTGGLKKKFQNIFGKDKRTKDLFKDAGMGAGVGLVGSFFLPGGPIAGALLGSAASIAMNTETFKTLMFGTGEVDENGKKNGGLFGKARDFIGHKILKPLSTTVQLAQVEFNAFVEKNMVLPLKRAMTPITDRLAKIGLNIENGFKGFFQSINDKFHEVVLKPLGNKVSEMLAPFKSAMAKIFKGIFGFFGNLISSPFRFIEGVAQGIYEQDKKKGGDFEVNKVRSKKVSEMKDTMFGTDKAWNDSYRSFLNAGMSEEEARRMADDNVGVNHGYDASFLARLKRGGKAGLGWIMADNKKTREKGEHGEHGASYYTKDDNIYTRRREDNARIDAETAQKKADILSGKRRSVFSIFGGKKNTKPGAVDVEHSESSAAKVNTSTQTQNIESPKENPTKVETNARVDVNESVKDQTVILKENHDKLSIFLTDFRDRLFAYLDNVKSTAKEGAESVNEKFKEGKESFRNATDKKTRVYTPNIETAESSSFKSSSDALSESDDRAEVVGPKQKKEKITHSTNWYLDKIHSDVSKISDSVYGQLNGVGSNVNKTYKLLLKMLGESDDNIEGDNNKSRVGLFGKLRTALNNPGKFIKNIGSNLVGLITKPFKAARDAVFTFVSGAKEAGKALISGAISLGKGLAKGLFEIIKLPGKLLSVGIEAVKAFGPAIGEAFKQTFRVVGTALVGGVDLIVSGIKGAAGVLKGAVTGLMDLAGGIFSMAGSLFKGAGIVGLELLKGGVKVGKKVVGGIARGVGAAAGLVASGVKNKFFKDKTPGASKSNLMYVNIVGGHLNEIDVVHTVERVVLVEKNDSFGDKASDTLKNVAERVYELFHGRSPGINDVPDTISGIFGDMVGFTPGEEGQETGLQLPAVVPNGLQLPALGLSSKFSNVANKVKQTLELRQRVKNNSADVQNARNAEEERTKLDLDFKAKLLGFMRRDEDRTVEHNTIWNKIFGPKGLLIAGLLFIGIPLIKKIFGTVKGIWNSAKNFVGDLAKTLGDAINKIAEGLKNIGGVGGAIGNALEMGGNFLSAITGKFPSNTMYATDEDGNMLVDENGKPIYQESKKLSITERVANVFTQNKQRVDHDTGKIYEQRDWTNVSGAMATGIKNVGVRALARNVTKGKNLVKMGTVLAGSSNSFAQKIGERFITKGSRRLAFDAKIAGGLKSAGGAVVGKAKTVISRSASGNGLIAKFISGGKAALQFLTTKVTGFLESKGMLNKSSKVTSLLKKAYTVLDDKILSKFAPKISAFFTKLSASATSAFILDAAFGAFGAINANPAAVFGVRKEDVDFKMQIIARLIKGILNTSMAGWIDLICQIIHEVLGFDLIQELCVLLYNIISDEKDEAKLAEARANYQSDYEDYVKEEYEAYMENVNENGGQPMTFEEYKQSPMCTSKSDYTVKQNPTLTQRVINTTKAVGGAIMHPIKTTKNLVAKGTAKLKKTATNVKNWASTKLESGLNKLKSIQETYFTGKPLGTVAKVVGTVFFPGVSAAATVAKGISKMTKKYGWFDPTGAYYVKNSDGTYNYYSANGDLIEENLDDPVIAANIASGIFVKGEIPGDHSAAKDSKSIAGKIKNFWSNAKDKIGGALDKAKNTVSSMWSRFKQWWGGDSSDTTEGGMGGYGDSKTGIHRPKALGGFGVDNVNNFPYYSQNDPRIKDQSYNLSNGTPDTMGNRGCGPTAMAMVASKLTGKAVDPKSAAKLAERAGFSTDIGTDPGYFGYAAKKYGLKSAEMSASADTIKQTIGKGIPAIIQGKSAGGSSPYTRNGHYVVATGMKGNQVLVNDPRGKSKSKAYSIDDLVKGSGHMWAFGGMGGYGDGPDTMNNFPYLSQSDSRWGSTPYTSIGDSSQTISSSGCGTTSMAMILRSFGNNVSPVDTAKYSLDHGFRTANSGTSWGFFSNIGKNYGITTTDLGKDSSAISNALASGKPIIGSMGPGYFTKGGHFITLVGADSGGNILVNDPAGTKGMERSSKSWPLSVFMNQGKNFWAFDKAGKGSIGNVIDAGTIQATQSISPTSVSTTGLTTSGADTSEEGGNKLTFSSITEWLGGLADAFMSPIKKFFGLDTSSDDTSTGTSGTSGYTGSSDSSNVATIDTKTGDYIGKYVAQFESGNKGPSMISSGKGDNGGVSFGSYQFPSYKKAVASSDSMLSKFWNKYYASKYPGVDPGDNQAFKDAWKKEADADSKGFFKNEHEFIADLYYVPFRNKVKSIVDLDNYDRAAQEAAWSTAVQFGSGNTVFDKAFGGQNQSATAPTDFINKLQDYKRDSVGTRFKSSSASVQRSIANRHDRDERNVLLGLTGKEPIGAHDIVDKKASLDAGLKAGSAGALKQLEYGDTTILQPTQDTSGGFGGYGLGKRPSSRIYQKTHNDVDYYVNRPGGALGGFGVGESGDPTVISLLEQALVELRGTNRGVASLNDKDFSPKVSVTAQDNSTHNNVTAGGNGPGSNQQRSTTGAPSVTFKGYDTAKKIAKGELLQQ